MTQEQIHEDIKKYVFDAIIPADMVDCLLYTSNRSTELLFYGEGSREMAESAFGMEAEDGTLYLEGVVSRKKQLIPALMEAAQMLNEYA